MKEKMPTNLTWQMVETVKHKDYHDYRKQVAAEFARIIVLSKRKDVALSICRIPVHLLQHIMQLSRVVSPYRTVIFHGWQTRACNVYRNVEIRVDTVCLQKCNHHVPHIIPHYWCVNASAHNNVAAFDSDKIAEWLSQVLFPFSMPMDLWQTESQWMKRYGERKSKWSSRVRLRYKKAIRTHYKHTTKILDTALLSQRLALVQNCTPLFCNLSQWTLGVSGLRQKQFFPSCDTKAANMMLLEPQNMRAAEAQQSLEQVLGRTNTERLVRTRNTSCGCQVFIFNRNVPLIYHDAILSNCLFDGFGKHTAKDARITPLCDLPRGLIVPISC